MLSGNLKGIGSWTIRLISDRTSFQDFQHGSLPYLG
jgi:hypothetical protein